MAEEQDYSGNNATEVNIMVVGDVSVTLNGDPINDIIGSKNKIKLTLEHEGDVLVTVNGEDFQVEKDES